MTRVHINTIQIEVLSKTLSVFACFDACTNQQRKINDKQTNKRRKIEENTDPRGKMTTSFRFG